MGSSIPSCFSATYSHHLSCHSWQPSSCISKPEQGAALAKETCFWENWLPDLSHCTITDTMVQAQGRGRKCRVGLSVAAHELVSWEHHDTSSVKNHSPCSSWNALWHALLAPFPHRLTHATSKFAAFPWRLFQVVDKHFLVMDTGNSSKRHLKPAGLWALQVLAYLETCTSKKKSQKNYPTRIYWGRRRNYATQPHFGLMLPYIC